MMSKRVCKVCGKGYSFCPDCVKDMDKPRWMISFDKAECKEIFDTLVKNSSGEVSDAEALKIVNSKNVKVTNSGILNHIKRLSSVPAVNVAEEVEAEEPKVKEDAVSVEKKSIFKSALTEEKQEQEKKEDKSEEKKEDDVKVYEPQKSSGSLFGKNNIFTSNSKNKEKTKQDAESISSALGELNEKQGF